MTNKAELIAAQKERWPGLFGQDSGLDKWILCRLQYADFGASRREGVARPERRAEIGGEIFHAAATWGRCSK